MASRPDHNIDPKVLARALEGQEEAWFVIVSRLFDRVSFSVRGWLQPQHGQHVEDVTQDVFLKVFRKLPGFDPSRGCQLATWVLTIARNHCVDFKRGRRRSVVTSSAPETFVARCPDPCEAALHSESLAQVEKAMAELDGDQREAFELRCLQGLQYRDISRRTGVSTNLVKSRANRARSKLRQRLKRLDPRTAA